MESSQNGQVLTPGHSRQKTARNRDKYRRKMDKKEAKDILAKELELYRKRSYADLLHLLNTQNRVEVTGQSGTVCQLEFHTVSESVGVGQHFKSIFFW
jgi:hypothetical protein